MRNYQSPTTLKTVTFSYWVNEKRGKSKYLVESGGKRDEKSGGGPEEGAEGDDVGPVVTHCQVSGDGVTEGLDHGAEQSQRPEPSRVGVESRTDLLVHAGE